MKRSERLIVVEKAQTSLFGISARILVDVETGVNYLWCVEGFAASITPLLGADGKPIVWTREEIERELMKR